MLPGIDMEKKKSPTFYYASSTYSLFTILKERVIFCSASYHQGDVVPPVARQRAVQLQQSVLGFQKAAEVKRVQSHHHGDVVHTTQREEGLDEDVLVESVDENLESKPRDVRSQ